MHLMAHLTDCIYDHGPVYAFWLYAFERMNGILGAFQTSNKDITVNWCTNLYASFEMWPEEYKTDYLNLIVKKLGLLWKQCPLISPLMQSPYLQCMISPSVPAKSEK